METIRIFLASSEELKEDRIAFEILIGRENKILNKRNVTLELEIWEDFIDKMSATRLQDEYNKALMGCDIFIMLFSTKVGKFTAEEFEKAFQQFKKTKKPYIYTYFKNIPTEVANKREDLQSLWAFQDKLKSLEHFQTEYNSAEGLQLLFKQQLDKLDDEGYINLFGDHVQPNSTTNIPKCLSAGQPSVTTDFIGRDMELADVKEKLNKHSLLLINAEGGMGKTTLAAKFLEQNIDQYKHYAWLFCDTGLTEQLKTIAPQLGIDLLLFMTEEKQLLEIKTRLENLGKECLLVLDNANEPKHLEDIQKYLGGLHTHILVTSRCKDVLPKEKEYTLNHFEPEVANQFFKSHYNENTGVFEKLLDKFLIAVGYNTLMIELFSKNLYELSALGETLESILKHFEVRGFFLGNKSFEIQTSWTTNVHKQVASTDDIINVIYDLTKLEEAERYILVNIALLPAESHQLKILLEAFTPENNIDFTKLLKNLARRGWLNNDTHTYRMNPVIQQIALAKNKKNLHQDAERLIYNLAHKLAHENGALINLKNYQEAQPFAVMAQSLSVQLLDESFESGMLVFHLSDYYKGIGNFISSVRELEVASAILEKIDKDYYSICLQRLGDIYHQQREFEKALQFFEKYNKLSEELVKENPNNELLKYGLAISYFKLGNIYQQEEDFIKALQLFKKCNELEARLVENNPHNELYKRGLAISYSKLGEAYNQQGDFKKALKFFVQENNLFKELFEVNPCSESLKRGLAISFERLGGIYEQEGGFEKALQFFGQEIVLMKELVETNPDSVLLYNGLAISFTKLGNLYEKMQKPEKVKSNYLKAEAIWVELTEKVPEAVEFAENLSWIKKQLPNL